MNLKKSFRSRVTPRLFRNGFAVESPKSPLRRDEMTRRGRAPRAAFESLEGRALLSAYFVSGTGSDSAAGTSAAPWKTLQHAAGAVAAGDVVTVRAGNYTGLQLGSGDSGTASARITFTAQSGAVINTGTSKGDGINLEGASFVTLEGFTITGVSHAGIRSVTNDGVIIRNNVVRDAAYCSILTGFSDHVVVENNVAAGGRNGIYIGNATVAPVVRGNRSYDHTRNGIHMNGDVSLGGSGLITNATVENNTIYNTGSDQGSAINLDGVQNSRIQNNLVYDAHASGISLYNLDAAAGAKNNVVAGNTVLTASDGLWALNIQDGSTGNVVFDNVLFSAHSYRGSINVSSNSTAGFVSDYNAVMDRFTTDDESTIVTLASWRSRTGQDAHSFVTTHAALFVNPAGGDYHLKAGAPAIDKGTATLASKAGPARDLEGNARPSGVANDAGAFESVQGTTPPADTTAPTASATASAVSAAGGTSYTFTVTYRDNTAVSVASLDGNDVQVTGPSGFSQLAALAGVDVNSNGTPRTATYRITPPGGARDSADNGTYTLSLRSAQVSDAAGNFAAAGTLGTVTVNVPAAPPATTPGTWTQTTAADFGRGTFSGTVVTNTAGGEVALATLGDEFNDTAVASTWSRNDWRSIGSGGPSPSITESAGVVTLVGSQLKSAQSAAGATVTGSVSFRASAYQAFGLATDLGVVAGNSWAVFSTASTTTTLFARVNSNGQQQTVSLGAIPTGYHTYQVQPAAGGYQFFIDGALKTTVASAMPAGTALKVALSDDKGASAAPLKADWVRTTAGPTSGTFVSSVFDAGRSATWGKATWTANLPAGTSIVVETSSGNTAAPDGTWSTWSAVSSGGTVSSPAARYLRYCVTLVTNTPGASPSLQTINFAWT